MNTERSTNLRPRLFHSSPFSLPFRPSATPSQPRPPWRSVRVLPFSTTRETGEAGFRLPLEPDDRVCPMLQRKHGRLFIERSTTIDVALRRGAHWNMKILPRIKITLARTVRPAILNNSWDFFTRQGSRNAPRVRSRSSRDCLRLGMHMHTAHAVCGKFSVLFRAIICQLVTLANWQVTTRDNLPTNNINESTSWEWDNRMTRSLYNLFWKILFGTLSTLSLLDKQIYDSPLS